RSSRPATSSSGSSSSAGGHRPSSPRARSCAAPTTSTRARALGWRTSRWASSSRSTTADDGAPCPSSSPTPSSTSSPSSATPCCRPSSSRPSVSAERGSGGRSGAPPTLGRMTDRPGERTPVADSPTRGAPRRKVLLVDVPESRVHRPRDLLELVLSVLGIGMVLLLAVYAHATAIGVTEDVQSAAALVLREILLLPVTVLEGVVTFFLPLFVVVMQLVRRRWRA